MIKIIKLKILFIIGISLFGHLDSKTNDVETSIQNLYRIPRYIWWNHYEAGPFMKMLNEMEDRLEKLKEKEQEKRNKIYRNKLVNRIRSSVLRDIWTIRY